MSNRTKQCNMIIESHGAPTMEKNVHMFTMLFHFFFLLNSLFRLLSAFLFRYRKPTIQINNAKWKYVQQLNFFFNVMQKGIGVSAAQNPKSTNKLLFCKKNKI